ncbi:MAG: hypothetical protein CME70_17250 [Halobacteriovorax sp.]|nr:hypothetical protein [Halobacteriovorax sp.]|tara:strand:- start:88408 stop:89205 length:798 start_codon:yes stop_codon:yes gene_type:complete
MSDWQELYIKILKDFWNDKKKINPSFSMRSFAKFLNCSPSVLSLILNGKRPLTTTKAIEFSAKLKLDFKLQEKFLEAVAKDEFYRLNETERKERSLKESLDYKQLQLDHFKVIHDWYHFGILNLCLIKGFQSNTSWIANSLGITVIEAGEAINRLKRLNLLREENGELIRTEQSLETPSDIPSSAIRNFHHQNIARAKASLESVDLENRDITSIMMPVDKTKLLEAKKMIKNFRKELSAFLKSGETHDQIYSLNIQLFPQSQELE